MMVRWAQRMGIFTFILALIAGWTAWILYETDQTSRLRDRAFIYFGDPQNGPYPPTDPVVWYAGVSIVNAGNMPARRVAIRFACPNISIIPKTNNVSDPWSKAKWENADIANVVGAKQAFSLQGCNVPIDIFTSAKNGEVELFVLMEVTYLDGFYFDKTRVTQMSRIFRFDRWGGRSLRFTDSHNCSDDDCQK